jgi:D-ribose pyranase
MMAASPGRFEELRALLGEVPLQVMSHLELKRLSQTGKATVRTGDTTPCANIVVVSG